MEKDQSMSRQIRKIKNEWKKLFFSLLTINIIVILTIITLRSEEHTSELQSRFDIVDLYFFPTRRSSDLINLFAEDHFHPNEFGYERMARRVLEYLADGEGSINEQAN